MEVNRRQVLRVRPMTKILAVILSFSVVWLLEAQSPPAGGGSGSSAPPAQDFGVRGGAADAGTAFSGGAPGRESASLCSRRAGSSAGRRGRSWRLSAHRRNPARWSGPR